MMSRKIYITYYFLSEEEEECIWLHLTYALYKKKNNKKIDIPSADQLILFLLLFRLSLVAGEMSRGITLIDCLSVCLSVPGSLRQGTIRSVIYTKPGEVVSIADCMTMKFNLCFGRERMMDISPAPCRVKG